MRKGTVSIETTFYDVLTPQAKKEFTTASSYHMSVYEFWKEKGYISPLQIEYLEKGFNGQAKNKSYYNVLRKSHV